MSRNPNLSFYNPPGPGTCRPPVAVHRRQVSRSRFPKHLPFFSSSVYATQPHHTICSTELAIFPHESTIRSELTTAWSCPVHAGTYIPLTCHAACSALGDLGIEASRLSALRHPTTAMNQLIRVCAKGTCPSSPKAPQPTTPILTGSNQAHASHSPQLSSILTTISEHKHHMSDLGTGTPSAAGQFQPQQQQTTIHL